MGVLVQRFDQLLLMNSSGEKLSIAAWSIRKLWGAVIAAVLSIRPSLKHGDKPIIAPEDAHNTRTGEEE